MDELLARQLRRLGLDTHDPPTDPSQWQSLLRAVDESYRNAHRSRYLLERSLRISSQEMAELYEDLQRTSEEQLTVERDRLRSVLDALADGVCLLDAEGRVVIANACAEKMLGDTEAELHGSRILSHFDAFGDERPPSQLMGASEPAAGLSVLRRPDTRIEVAYTLDPVRPGGGGGAVFVFRDLTRLRVAERAAAESAGMFETLFGSSPLAIFEEDFSPVEAWLDELREQGVTDLDAYLSDHPDALLGAVSLVDVRDVNEAAVRLLGAPDRESLLGRLPTETFTESSLESFRMQLDAIWRGHDRVETTVTGADFAGHRIDVVFHWSVTSVDGTPDYSKVLVAAADISAQKAAEIHMQELMESKDEFLASVSHELRTPLTAVLGAADLLVDAAAHLEPGDREELLGFIRSESLELAHIVEDLLVAARGDLGNVQIHCEESDIADIVEGVIDAVAFHGKTVEVEVSGVAWADPVRVRQIVRNLLTNAVRYGGDHIRVHSRSDGERLSLAVDDDGPGISPDDAAAIFKAYTRAHNAEGLAASVGLGLTVSRQLAELMGGSLHYEALEPGSRFVLEVAQHA